MTDAVQRQTNFRRLIEGGFPIGGTMSKVFNRETRKWIYSVLVAAFPVAAVFWPEILPAVPLWLGLALALLNLTPKDVDTSASEVAYADIKAEVLAKFSELDYESQTADIQAARSHQGLGPI